MRPSFVRPARYVLLIAGAAAIVALLGADPAVAAYLLDADLLVLLGSVGFAILAADLRHIARHASASSVVVLMRTGARMTYEQAGLMRR